jgi:hypothetical protein
LIFNKFEKEIVFESSVLAPDPARIRIEQKCWIRIRIISIRIHNPGNNTISRIEESHLILADDDGLHSLHDVDPACASLSTDNPVCAGQIHVPET